MNWCGLKQALVGAAVFTVALLMVAAPAHAKKRVIILGFDGVDPNIVTTMIDAGQLPNLAKLRGTGAFQPLGSSNPPQSPTAWSSFVTCKNPGNHGIYDFIRRDPKTYLPMDGFGSVQHAKLAQDGSVAQAPAFTNYRKGATFWAEADRQHALVKILSVPFAYPASTLEQGCELSGLGVPDLRGTTSTFFYFSDSFTPQQIKEPLSGGVRLPLQFDGDTAIVKLPGARDVTQTKPAYVETPITIKANRAAHTVAITLPTTTIALKEGEWSEWIGWAFQVTPEYTVHAISRIHVLEAGEQVRLYMTCLQFDPRDPYIPFTSPNDYAKELAERYGLFKTIGWDYDTHALRQDVLSEDLFLEDVKNSMAWREQLTLDEIDRGNFDLLVSAWTATDRVAHLFWAYRDPKHPLYTEEMNKKYGHAVEETYEIMDRIAGKVMAKLEAEDLFMVLSDHGFHSFRSGFNVNTWLIRNGYLTVKGQTDPASAFTDTPFLQGYDWPRTRAYSIGLGSVFLNLKGREGQGIVAPEDANALIAEIREKLLAVTDPGTGDKVFNAVYTRDYYKGTATDIAPDLQLGYAEGYQSTKDTAKGAAPKELFEPNTDKWSGEHAASDIAITPGILFANKALAAKDPALVDLGVSALTYLGLNVPQDFEGRPLF